MGSFYTLDQFPHTLVNHPSTVDGKFGLRLFRSLRLWHGHCFTPQYEIGVNDLWCFLAHSPNYGKNKVGSVWLSITGKAHENHQQKGGWFEFTFLQMYKTSRKMKMN